MVFDWRWVTISDLKEWTRSLGGYISESWTWLIDLAGPYSDWIVLAGILLIAIGAMLFAYAADKGRRYHFRRKRGEQMTRKERQQYIKTVVGDAITDVLEEMEYKGILHRSEVRRLYRQLGMVLNVRGLLPSKANLTKQEMAALEAFVKSVRSKKPLPIPGPKPGEPDNLNIKLVPLKDYKLPESDRPAKWGGNRKTS